MKQKSVNIIQFINLTFNFFRHRKPNVKHLDIIQDGWKLRELIVELVKQLLIQLLVHQKDAQDGTK